MYEILEEGNNLKKTLCLILALLFTFLFTTMVFAATDDIKDPLTPLSPDIVTDEQYSEFEEELPPESAPITNMEDQVVPAALPQTGGIPAEAFYIVGGICILSAVLLLTRTKKSSAK